MTLRGVESRVRFLEHAVAVSVPIDHRLVIMPCATLEYATTGLGGDPKRHRRCAQD